MKKGTKIILFFVLIFIMGVLLGISYLNYSYEKTESVRATQSETSYGFVVRY